MSDSGSGRPIKRLAALLVLGGSSRLEILACAQLDRSYIVIYSDVNRDRPACHAQQAQLLGALQTGARCPQGPHPGRSTGQPPGGHDSCLLAASEG